MAEGTDGRTVLKVRMELLSDAIFGSGFSVPGGEDVAVNQDRRGWPFMKGSTFKGLLRESLENLLVWTGRDSSDLDALMGVPGWNNPGGPRRIHLTELTPENPPASPEQCYSIRTFTSLDGGVVKTDTLRTAACICQGLVFTGLLYCQEADADLLKKALSGVKWVGTMRSRGFGRVRVSGSAAEQETEVRISVPSNGAACIRYHIHTDSPVLATDMARSWGNSWETLHCIPGGAVRGAVIRRYVEEHPDEAGRETSGFLRELLSEGVRFSDAFPTVKQDHSTDGTGNYRIPLPSPMGFYEDKKGGRFQSILRTGKVDPACKPAKLGHFCALDGGKILYWKASTDSTLRILRGSHIDRSTPDGSDERQVFETRYLDAGQVFTGSILLNNPALAGEICRLFSEKIWLGADRCGGFGTCTVAELTCGDLPEVVEQYGLKADADVTETLYLLLLSPLSMPDENGEPCGLNEAVLEEKLGVDTVRVELCAASVSDYSGYNSAWACRVPGMRMYDRGSVFKLRCGSAPALSRIRVVERDGLGIRRAEGYGQVLFLSRTRFEALTDRQNIERQSGTAEQRDGAAVRRAKLRWIMEKAEAVQAGKFSKSQLGTIQTLCENAVSHGGNCGDLWTFLQKNLTGRGARHGDRFTGIAELIHQTMEQDGFVPEETGVKSDTEKLKLLCQLFDFSRKEETE